jgi:membrane-bound lytic murein transglycosylase D
MDQRKKRILSYYLSAICFLAVSCSSVQQSRFQSSFLPPAPHSAAFTLQLADPPALALNPYLPQTPFLEPSPGLPLRRSQADNLVQQADKSFQRAKRLYQSNDVPNARSEFNRAVDLMLEASDQNPSDRLEYEKKFDDMVDAVHRIDLAGLGASAEFEEARFEKAPLEDILQMTFPVDPRLKDKVHEQVAATVSQLPLMVTDPVLSYIHFFDTRGRKTLVAGIQRSGRYQAMIRRILDEEGIPQELIHLAQAESGFWARAVSYKAAGGMWQFLTWRGQEYGLMQTKYTDDRMDPERATRAAARHLHDLYNEFGDWYLAVAAYNCGPGVVEKAVERTGYADFWELRSRGVLPAETTNYVPIILALTIMEKNPAEYGLQNLDRDLPIEYDTIETTAPTSLALIADLADAPLSEIVELNPAVLKNIAPPNYAIHVPKGSGEQLMASLELIPPEHRNSWRMHRVDPGETLAAIVKQFGTPTNVVMAVNKLVKAEAVAGDRLIIPVSATIGAEPKRSKAPAATRRRSIAVRNTATLSTHKPAIEGSSVAVARASGQ